MREADRERLHAWSRSRDADWYANHPNADRAVERLVAKLASYPLRGEETVRRHVSLVESPLEGCPLSVRELQVLGGYAAGLEGREIAEVLGVAPETVKDYAKRCYARLGLSAGLGQKWQRSLAVALAFRNGWF